MTSVTGFRAEGRARRAKSFRTGARESLLTVVAVLGGLCIAALIAAAVFNITFVVFRSGSMEPAYPVGALAAVSEVPALSLKPGDVATLSRTPGSTPITHRVVSVMPDPALAGQAIIVLKGDANRSPDPVEYRVATARQMLFVIPGLGRWVMDLRSPMIVGCSTVLVAALVAWSFWPRSADPAPKRKGLQIPATKRIQ